MSWTSCSVAQAVECVTIHPAKLLGIADKKGALTPGHDADLVVLDDAGNVCQTWKFGVKVFDATEVETAASGLKQEIKKMTAAKTENVPFGERFTVPGGGLKISTGVRVH